MVSEPDMSQAFSDEASHAAFGTSPIPLAPSRKIRRLVRRVMPSGRVHDFLFAEDTVLDDMSVWSTLELVRAPTLDCPCMPRDPSDIVECRCLRNVCRSSHARCCTGCGVVHCSRCMFPHELRGRVVCRECAFQMLKPRYEKLIRFAIAVTVRLLILPFRIGSHFITRARTHHELPTTAAHRVGHMASLPGPAAAASGRPGRHAFSGARDQESTR